MLVQLNSGRIMNLDSVSTVDVNEEEKKIRYTLDNNTVLTEQFETAEEVSARLKELFDFQYTWDRTDMSDALRTARSIQGL